MSSAYGHRVLRMTAAEATGQSCSAGRGKAGPCHQPALFLLCYRYVTGRQGRTTTSESPACTAHTERFAERHAVPIPAETAPPRRNLVAEAIAAINEMAGRTASPSTGPDTGAGSHGDDR